MLSEGDLAHDFTLSTGDGSTLTLSALRGAPVVVYFYPRDNTPGCTKEACDFRDASDPFRQRGAQVVGISPDPPSRHAGFAAKHGLTFPLLSDPDHAVCDAYGVWTHKKLYGRTFLGIQRSTFLIDAAGVIRAIWRGVTVKGHVAEVLQRMDALGIQQ